MTVSSSITVDFLGLHHFVSVTNVARNIVRDTAASIGLLNLCIYHTTAALVTMEYDAGVIADVTKWIRGQFPLGQEYRHHRKGFDMNGAAHVGCSVLGTSLNLNVLNGDIVLGRYQDVVAINLQAAARPISIGVIFVGEKAE